MYSPLISVVVPTYNRIKVLEEAIGSVLNQTYNSIEVIVVDDCSSSQEAKEMLFSLSKRNVVVLENAKNLGPSISRRIGIEHARGEYIALLDSDDVFLPEKLEKLVLALQSNQSALFAYGGWEWCDFDTNIVRVRRIPDAAGLINGKPRWTYNIVPDLVATSFYKKNSFNENLRNYELYDILIKLAISGSSVSVSSVLSKFRDHHGKRSSDDINARINAIDYLLDNYEGFINAQFKDFYYDLLKVKVLDSLEHNHHFDVDGIIKIIKNDPFKAKFYLSVAKRLVSKR